MIPAVTISPQDVTQCFRSLGISNRFDHSEELSLETTGIVTRPGFLSFPTPRDNSNLSVLGLRRVVGVDSDKPPSFYDHPWYLGEAFGEKVCEPGWHSIEMNVIADSIGKAIYHADELKERGLYLPSAVEVLLMLFFHFAATGERLLNRGHTWTYDRTTEGRFVTVGAFGRNGVFVSSHEVGFQSKGLGICAKVDPKSEVRDSSPPSAVP